MCGVSIPEDLAQALIKNETDPDHHGKSVLIMLKISLKNYSRKVWKVFIFMHLTDCQL